MPRSDHMVKPFLPSFLRRGTLYPLRVKSGAVQHAMLVGFLALLCPDKEVHLILKNIDKARNSQLEIVAFPREPARIDSYIK